MSVTLKAGVRLHPMATMLHALWGLPGDHVVTSGRDSTHSLGSFHYDYLALDIRSHDLTVAARTQLIADLQARLGPNYEILYEGDGTPNAHVHIQHDPQ